MSAEEVDSLREQARSRGDEVLVAVADVLHHDRAVRAGVAASALNGLVDALAVLESYPLSVWTGRAHAAVATALAELGEDGRALEHLHRQREIGQALDDLLLQAEAANDAALLTPSGEERLEAFAAAEALFARASVDTEQAVVGAVVARLNRAETLVDLGLLAAAGDQLPYVVEMARALDEGKVEGVALATQGRCLAAGGRPHAGIELVERALARAAELPQGAMSAVQVECARSLLVCGRADLAVAVLDQVRHAEKPTDRHERTLDLLAQSLAALGESRRAFETLREADDLRARRLDEVTLARLDGMRAYHRSRAGEQARADRLDASARMLEHVQLLVGRDAPLRDQDLRDDTTGLPNRRFLDVDLRWRCGQRLPDGGVVALLLVRVNEVGAWSRGGPDADRRAALLVEVGRVVADNVRGGDALARYGPDTFAVVAFQRSREAATFAADRLRAALTTHSWSSAVGVHRVTTSIGLRVVEPPCSADRVVAGAEAALSRAVAAGGGAVRVDG